MTDSCHKLDIDKDNERWIPAYIAVMNGKTPVCPNCGRALLEVKPVELKNRIGFMTITCKECCKIGYFSRVEFPEDFRTEL